MPLPAKTNRLSNADARELLNKKAKKKAPIKWGAPAKLSESELQTECVNWFREKHPKYEKLLWANPNGGFRHKRTAAILKREGVLSGVPDITLAIPRSAYHGLYLELKIKGNTTTDNQKEMLRLLSEQGYRCEVVFSTEQFKEVITEYLTAA